MRDIHKAGLRFNAEARRGGGSAEFFEEVYSPRYSPPLRASALKAIASTILIVLMAAIWPSPPKPRSNGANG